jgi:hypothetical protein
VFARNACEARVLNIAHMIVPLRPMSIRSQDKLVAWLNENVCTTLGRTYGGGLVKFEPGEAMRIPIPAELVDAAWRGYGKATQEALVKDFLRSLKYKEVPPAKISTIVDGPQRGEFCGESIVGGDKADVVPRLNDTRLMLIECKVSNSAVNSFKRINHEAAGKARKWLASFGTAQVVPTSVIGGVFNVNNLLRAQEDGLTLFWAHGLKKLGQFVASVERK